MYKEIVENAIKQRSEQFDNGWIEWESLEPESREYVLNYLSGTIKNKVVV